MVKSNANKLAEGRGLGYGPDYVPWLFVHEVPSKGLSMRTLGWKTDRVHHLLSQLETRYFYLLEWSDNVVDIREQYPLLPIEETKYIAKDLRIRHPFNTKAKEPSVFTTDFLITVKSGMGVYFQAVAIKPKKALLDKRTSDKLKIEQQYWLRRNIPWEVITEDGMPIPLCNNIRWLHPTRNLDPMLVPAFFIPILEKDLIKQLTSHPSWPLSKATSHVDSRLHLPVGTSLKFARHLLATKKWRTDMTTLINPDRQRTFTF